MVAGLIKTPLTAVLFAALFCFVAPFIPLSQTYSDSLGAFSMPLMGYVFMIAYWLFISIIVVLIFAETRYKGIKMMLFTLLTLAGAVWAVPMLRDIVFGEPAGIMDRRDLLFQLARYAGTGILLLVLGMMLFRRHETPPPPPKPGMPPLPPKAEPKFHLKKLDLVIKFLVLPVIYMVVYYLVWYFVLWRVEAVRTYFGAAERSSFAAEIINILLTDAKQVPMVLIQGLAYALLLLPLLLQMAGKRVMYIIASVLLLLAPAVQMLIPSAVMPDAVRSAYLLEIAAIAVVYGGLGSFLLSLSLHKEEPPPTAPKQPMTPAQIAAARAAAAAKKAAAAQEG